MTKGRATIMWHYCVSIIGTIAFPSFIKQHVKIKKGVSLPCILFILDRYTSHPTQSKISSSSARIIFLRPVGLIHKNTKGQQLRHHLRKRCIA